MGYKPHIYYTFWVTGKSKLQKKGDDIPPFHLPLPTKKNIGPNIPRYRRKRLAMWLIA